MKTQIVLVLFLVVFFACGLGATCLGQTEDKKVTVERTTVAIPSGSVMPTEGFSLSFSSESRLPLENGPVKVIGNASKVEDGIGMTRVLLENSSNNEVVAVKLRWYPFKDPESKSYVKTGVTKELNVDHLKPNEKKVVRSGIPGFDEMFGSLSKNGFISGRYYLEAVVEEVVFADKSKWKLPDKSSASK
jgi:hypothetical protein